MAWRPFQQKSKVYFFDNMLSFN